MLHTRGLLLSGRFKLFDYLGAVKLALLEMRQVGAAGTALPNLLQVGHKLLNLLQVWFKYAKLAVSMAVQAILGAFLAALGSMIMLVRSSRFIVGSLKLRINSCLQIRRRLFCFKALAC